MRTFIAIDVNQEIKDTSEEVISKLQELGFKAAWTKPENVHLTLFFMGEMDEKAVDSMVYSLNKRMKGFPSFSTKLTGLEYFRFKHSPRVLFLKFEPTKSLQKMYLEMKAELTKNKVKYDDQGNFVPHATLGRKGISHRLGKKSLRVNYSQHITCYRRIYRVQLNVNTARPNIQMDLQVEI